MSGCKARRRRCRNASNGLIIDCRHMPGYDREAREAFVQWNKARRDLLRGVAIVTDNTMYRMVIGAMSLAASVDMKAFDTDEKAASWLQSLPEGR
jgi:hypothetical protein